MIHSAPRFYAIRLVKGAPRSPAKLWYGLPVDPVTGEPLDRSPRWQAILNGEEVEYSAIVIEFDGVTREPIVKGEVIDEDEYDHLCNVREWALQNPTAPEANPREPINHLEGDLLF